MGRLFASNDWAELAVTVGIILVAVVMIVAVFAWLVGRDPRLPNRRRK